jgi:Dihaem cytochrome c
MTMNTNTNRWIFDIAAWSAGMLAILLLVVDASAKDVRWSAGSDPAWNAECGSCHAPYPPELLPARSWRAIMAGLDRHFGSDASIDPKAREKIEAFLVENAGRDAYYNDAAPLRITDTRWFKHEHARRPLGLGAKSWADCAACHVGSADPEYGERAQRSVR